MKIINLHGFMGEADNKNYKVLCDIISKKKIISPKLHYKEQPPDNILSVLSDMVDSDDFVFVGQSLGGWYADKLSRKFNLPCILTNPCFYPHKLGIIIESGIPSEYTDRYDQLSVHIKNPKSYTLCSDTDKILPDNYVDCIRLSSMVVRVHGSHSTIEELSIHLKEAVDYFMTCKND